MHQVIRILIRAKNKEEALDEAKIVLEDNLVGENKAFDYGTFFDEDKSMSGKNRWGKTPPVVKADSKEGKELIKQGMEITENEFNLKWKDLKNLLENYSKKELFEGEILDTKKKIIKELNEENSFTDNPFLFRYFCYALGQSEGDMIWLYNEEGEGIRSQNDLRRVMEELNDGKELFVIPVDVHH